MYNRILTAVGSTLILAFFAFLAWSTPVSAGAAFTNCGISFNSNATGATTDIAASATIYPIQGTSWRSTVQNGGCTVPTASATGTITLNSAGTYLCNLGVSAREETPGGDQLDFMITDDGVLVPQCEFDQTLTQNMSNRGAVSCLVNVGAGSVMVASVENDINQKNVTVFHAAFNCILLN